MGMKHRSRPSAFSQRLRPVSPLREPNPADEDELAIALHTVAEFGQWIRSADSKAALLAGVQGLLITGLLDRSSLLASALEPRGLAGWAASVALIAFLVGLASSLAFLAGTQLPRLASPPLHAGRLGFPSAAYLTADALVTALEAAPQRRQVWRQTGILARIAMVKFRALRWALVTTLVTLLAFLLWICLAAVTLR